MGKIPDELEEFSTSGSDEEVNESDDSVLANDAIVDEETLSHNNKMYFSPEQGYSANRLEDIYKPEDHYEKERMHQEMIQAFDTLIDAHNQYLFLRSIDINKVIEGDTIYVDIDTTTANVFPKPTNFILCKILHTDGKTYKVVDEAKGKQYTTTREHIKSVDEYISRLKSYDMAFIYINIKKYMKSVTSEIEYFDIFSTYFRIHEKILYNALPENVKWDLLKELDKKTGVFAKKDINPMW